MVPLLDRDRASLHDPVGFEGYDWREFATMAPRRLTILLSGHADQSPHVRQPSGVLGQEIEEAHFAEKFLNARGSVDDPQLTVRARGQVIP